MSDDAIQALMQQGRSALQSGDMDRARNLYEQVLAQIDSTLSETGRSARFMLGLIEIHTANYNQARYIYVALLDEAQSYKDPRGEHLIRHQLGIIEWLDGQYGAALGNLAAEKTLLNVHFPDANCAHAANAYIQGDVMLAMGRADAAADLMRQALALVENCDELTVEANVYRGLGDVAVAIKDYAAAQRHYSHSHNLFVQAGQDQAAAEIARKRDEITST